MFVEPLFAWLPDGKWVITDGLVLLSTESGETRSLTSPPMKSSSDFSPSVSPDGHTVAFSRWPSTVSDIYLLDLTEDSKPKGEPRRLTSLKDLIFGSAWTPNGREIIFASGIWSGNEPLEEYRLPGPREPEQLPFSAGEASGPPSPGAATGSLPAEVHDTNIWRLSLSGPGVATAPQSRFIASTREEAAAQYSPDGKRLAFESNRSGVFGIWVSDADGSNAVGLFLQTGTICGTPAGRPMGNASPSTLLLKGTLISLSCGRVEENQFA